MVISLNIREPQYRPQNTIVLIMGTPQMVTLISGNYHVFDASSLGLRNSHLGCTCGLLL